MDTEIYLKGLLELTKYQMRVVYRTCEGKSPEEIVDELDRTVDTYHHHMRIVYRALKITGDEKKLILLTQVCPIVSTYVHSLEEVERWDVIKDKIRLDIKKLEEEPIPAPPIFYPPEPEEEEEEPEPEPEPEPTPPPEPEPEPAPIPEPIPDEPIIDIPRGRVRPIEPVPTTRERTWSIVVMIGIVLIGGVLLINSQRENLSLERFFSFSGDNEIVIYATPVNTKLPYEIDWLTLEESDGTWMYTGERSWKNYYLRAVIQSLPEQQVIVKVRTRNPWNYIEVEYTVGKNFNINLIENGIRENLYSADRERIPFSQKNTIELNIYKDQLTPTLNNVIHPTFIIPEDFPIGYVGIRINQNIAVHSVSIHPIE